MSTHHRPHKRPKANVDTDKGVMTGVCFELNEAAFPIRLEQNGINRFTVVYGKQVDDDLTYAQACTELGRSIMHALACDGKVDNREGRRTA